MKKLSHVDLFWLGAVFIALVILAQDACGHGEHDRRRRSAGDAAQVPELDPFPPQLAGISIADYDSSAGLYTALMDVAADQTVQFDVRYATSEAGLPAASWGVLAASGRTFQGWDGTGLPTFNGTLWAEVRAQNAYGSDVGICSVPVLRQVFDPVGYTVVNGTSYWLPDDWPEASYKGYEWSPYSSTNQHEVTTEWLRWSSFENATPGVYDWSYIDEKLAVAVQYGKKVNYRILNSARLEGETSMFRVPQCYRGLLTEIVLPSTVGWAYPIYVSNVWHPTVAAAYNDFIIAFGERYADHPNVQSILIHGISNSRGEEYTLEPGGSPSDLSAIWNEWGADATVIGNWLYGRMDAFAEAFVGYEYKVGWVGTATDAWPWAPQAWQDLAVDLVDYAWSLGFGNRCGIVEAFTDHLNDYAIGTSVDSDGYCYVDESIPPIANGRYFAEENEAYGPSWSWWYGDDHSSPHRFKFSTLEALRRRFNHLLTSTAADAIDPPLLAYATAVMGHTVATTPDAWCYLRQTAVTSGVTAALAIKNIERWLIQRDVAGGMTVPAEWTPRTFNAGWEPGPSYGDWAARRTNFASGDDRIFFQADSGFDLSDPLTIMVEVRESSAVSWCIEYADPEYGVVQSEAYTCAADGQVRTVSWAIGGIDAGGLSNGMDFCIRRLGGKGDVTVRFVRVVHGT